MINWKLNHSVIVWYKFFILTTDFQRRNYFWYNTNICCQQQESGKHGLKKKMKKELFSANEKLVQKLAYTFITQKLIYSEKS